MRMNFQKVATVVGFLPIGRSWTKGPSVSHSKFLLLKVPLNQSEPGSLQGQSACVLRGLEA